MKDHQIFVEQRDIYGSTKYYPACNDSKMLAQLAGTKTLTPEALHIIKRLGFIITTVLPEPINL